MSSASKTLTATRLALGLALALAAACGSDPDPVELDAARPTDGGDGPIDADHGGAIDADNGGGIDADHGGAIDGGGVDGGAGGTLTFLTYNVHGLPSIVTGDDTTARITAIAPLLNRFDVVGLQEDFIVENHTILEDASTHTLETWFSAIESTQVYGSGLSVFANLAEVEIYTEWYTACNGLFDAGSDCLSSKGFHMVRVQIAPGVEVDLYNTHLDAGGGAADDAAREIQVDQLIASITTRSAGRAIVFSGDTNLDEDDPDEGPLLARFLSEAGLSDSCDAVSCAEPGHIDRVLFRESSSVGLTVVAWTNEPAFFDSGGTPLSDHPALSVRFAWTRR